MLATNLAYVGHMCFKTSYTDHIEHYFTLRCFDKEQNPKVPAFQKFSKRVLTKVVARYLIPA